MQRLAAWSILFTAPHLRLVDAGRAYPAASWNSTSTRTDDEWTFVALWSVVHATAFHAGSLDDRARIRSLVDRSEQHASGVLIAA
jgi:hypothetical protein